jgi:nucleotide-binding universal stress UspA family protein
MPYKTILVHVDQSRHLEARVQAAARIAAAQQAHLVGVAMIDMARFLYEMLSIDTQDSNTVAYIEGLRERANEALQKFEIMAKRIGVKSFEKRLVNDELAGGIGLQARYCDLVVLGQPDPDEPAPSVMADFPAQAVLTCKAPVLIVPYAGRHDSIGENVLIAWNGSEEATRAVHDAIPVLQRARKVTVAMFNPAWQRDMQGKAVGADLADYLARQGITIDLTEQTTDVDAGEALLALAGKLGADLLVMGYYGHSRFREMVLGGTTRTVLSGMSVAVLGSR